MRVFVEEVGRKGPGGRLENWGNPARGALRSRAAQGLIAQPQALQEQHGGALPDRVGGCLDALLQVEVPALPGDEVVDRLGAGDLVAHGMDHLAVLEPDAARLPAQPHGQAARVPGGGVQLDEVHEAQAQGPGEAPLVGLDGEIDLLDEGLGGEGLLDEAEGSPLVDLLAHLGAAEGRDEDDGQIRLDLLRLDHQVDAIDHGHLEIGDQDIDLLPMEEGQRLHRVGADLEIHGRALAREVLRHRPEEILFVIHHQDTGHGRRRSNGDANCSHGPRRTYCLICAARVATPGP